MKTKTNQKWSRSCVLGILFSSLLFTSCEKDEHQRINEDVSDFQAVVVDDASGRLILNSHDVFAEIVQQLKSDPNEPLPVRFQKSIGSKNYKEFITLKNCNAKSQIEEDTLVIDDDFAALLNSENAIQVENTIYRITPYGTFVYIADKEDRANEIINSFYNGKIVDEVEKDNYLFEIEDGVLRYDTYQEMKDNTIEINDNSIVCQPQKANSNEQDVDVYTIVNKHTIVGSFLQNTFGYTASYTRYFSSKRRMKVSFSSPNFVLFSYISISVKMQKKNWIGWSGINAEELILGWDGMTYKFNNPVPIPENAKPQNTWRFYNPNWTAYEMNPPKSKNTYIAFHLDNYQFNLTSKEVAKGYKLAFNYLKGLLDPRVPTDYLAIITDPYEMTISREDTSKKNQEKLVHTFDYSIGMFKFSWNMNGSIGVNNFPVQPMSFTLKNASIFGMAKFGDEWKGIRIEKL